MHYLSDSFIDDVYHSLLGSLTPQARIPGVQNLFLEGSPCETAYSQMLQAYAQLLARLKEQEEDSDVETIITSLLTISRILGKEMYRCGAEFALNSKLD